MILNGTSFNINSALLALKWRYSNDVVQSYTGWPRNNGTVDAVDFQDFALINSYFLRLVG